MGFIIRCIPLEDDTAVENLHLLPGQSPPGQSSNSSSNNSNSMSGLPKMQHSQQLMQNHLGSPMLCYLVDEEQITNPMNYVNGGGPMEQKQNNLLGRDQIMQSMGSKSQQPINFPIGAGNGLSVPGVQQLKVKQSAIVTQEMIDGILEGVGKVEEMIMGSIGGKTDEIGEVALGEIALSETTSGGSEAVIQTMQLPLIRIGNGFKNLLNYSSLSESANLGLAALPNLISNIPSLTIPSLYQLNQSLSLPLSTLSAGTIDAASASSLMQGINAFGVLTASIVNVCGIVMGSSNRKASNSKGQVKKLKSEAESESDSSKLRFTTNDSGSESGSESNENNQSPKKSYFTKKSVGKKRMIRRGRRQVKLDSGHAKAGSYEPVNKRVTQSLQDIDSETEPEKSYASASQESKSESYMENVQVFF